jgi:hypothetical protein
MGIKEEEEVQPICIGNIFNKRTAENFPNLVKGMLFQMQEAFRTLDRIKIGSLHGML